MELYLNIEQAIRQQKNSLYVGNNVTEQDVRHAIRSVMRDNPELFWFDHQHHFDKDNGIVSFGYRCSPDRAALIQESIDDVVQNDFHINYVRTLTPPEQVAYVYKWLLTYCNYNTKSAYYQDIESVFIRRNSACTGYAKAAQYLFQLLGIESCLVFGRLNKDKEDGRHCWNIVNIAGHYYHLDICLGDWALEDVLREAGITTIQRYGNYNYNCFCVSTDEILKTHSIEDIETLPPCNQNLSRAAIERLSRIYINKRRDELDGCQSTPKSSSAERFHHSRTCVEEVRASEPEASPVKPKKGIDYIPQPEGSYAQGAIAGGAVGSVLIPGAFLGVIRSWLREKVKKKEEYDEVYSSIFAPSEVKRKSHMLVQVYLHLYEETEEVKALARESDKDAERRDYIPLQHKLKKGDKVDVLLNIYGVTLLMTDQKSVVWQGSFTKCSFDFFVPEDIGIDELSCVAIVAVNGVPYGELKFITKIVDSPRQLNPEIIAHKYSKVFISYSHQDESKVRFLHEGLELGSVPHFFDRNYLKVGDVFPLVIQEYINSADLFILCWSENAAKSEYVQKERTKALERAYPQVKPEQAAKLRIYPISIEPRADLPSDMKNYYHFGEL